VLLNNQIKSVNLELLLSTKILKVSLVTFYREEPGHESSCVTICVLCVTIYTNL
jgi:hypothetical protein